MIALVLSIHRSVWAKEWPVYSILLGLFLIVSIVLGQGLVFLLGDVFIIVALHSGRVAWEVFSKVLEK